MSACDPALHNGKEVPASFIVRLWLDVSDNRHHGRLVLDRPTFSFSRASTFACCTDHLGHAVQTLMVNGAYLDGRSKITVHKA